MEEKKKPIYKKWWFWVIIVILVIGIVGSQAETTSNNGTLTSANIVKQEDRPEVIVTDFTEMPQELVKSWFETNNVDGKIVEEYSDTVPKGEIINQSVQAHTTIHQGDKIIVKYSLGRKPTTGERNALEKAHTYSSMMNMSKQGIYKQLTSSVEGFTKDEAQYAIDNINADWNKNALEKAKTYQNTMSMSKNAIYRQLTSSVEGFTKDEAQYAIDNLED